MKKKIEKQHERQLPLIKSKPKIIVYQASIAPSLARTAIYIFIAIRKQFAWITSGNGARVRFSHDEIYTWPSYYLHGPSVRRSCRLTDDCAVSWRPIKKKRTNRVGLLIIPGHGA